MIDLKPCPFCGSTEIHTYEPTVYEIGNDASVNCENPICSAEVRGNSLKEAIAKWNRRAEEERNTHVEHTVSISTGSITKEELDRYLWERSVDILPYIIPCDDTPEMSFDEALDRKIREAVERCLEEHYREKEEEE